MTNAVSPLLKTTIDSAVSILKTGGLVAMPTETVYGLACDARNETALRALYALKGRPGSHPVIVHLAHAEQLDEWAIRIPKAARVLAESFWPGPMTLILQKHPSVPGAVTGGQATVGIRVPDHPVALQLLRAFGGGLAAPSANKFGKISPTTAAHVQADLGSGVPLVLDGGACDVGVESTIIDCSKETVLRVLRPGLLSLEMIRQALAKEGAEIPVEGFQPKQDLEVRVSGSLESHYAPDAKVALLSHQEIETFLSQGGTATIGVMSFSPETRERRTAGWVQMPAGSEAYSRRLYATLRSMDALNVDHILVERPPELPGWEAVWDRLKRAAAPRP